MLSLYMNMSVELWSWLQWTEYCFGYIRVSITVWGWAFAYELIVALKNPALNSIYQPLCVHCQEPPWLFNGYASANCVLLACIICIYMHVYIINSCFMWAKVVPTPEKIILSFYVPKKALSESYGGTDSEHPYYSAAIVFCCWSGYCICFLINWHHLYFVTSSVLILTGILIEVSCRRKLW